MFSFSAVKLPGLRPKVISAADEPKSRPSVPDVIPFIVSEPQPRKFKGSSQLNRWSLARALRSGRKLDRPGSRSNLTTGPEVPKLKEIVPSEASTSDGEAEMTGGKSIYMVSDGTGWTAEHAVDAALGQFEHCLVDRGCPINTHLFSGIEDEEQLMEIIKQAAKENAMVVYTLADPSMAESARRACELWCVPSTDILGPITDSISSHLGVTPSGLPRGALGKRHSSLTEEYFKRIEAIEFTIKQDDGALPENLHKADIVLVGVSRTGKTPLSTYLAQKGYKTANVPIVEGIELPRSLFEIDPTKVFGLTINPAVLQAIRRGRSKTLGISLEGINNYSDMGCVRKELEFAGRIFAQNPLWSVIEVTETAIEETAAVVLRLYHDRQLKCSMPRISKSY